MFFSEEKNQKTFTASPVDRDEPDAGKSAGYPAR
jgi:hypothetical protein